MPVEGVIANLWNATSTATTGISRRFVGVEWNATLGAGQSTDFGFCANL
jgi:cellulase/cellobiase CelA1